MRDFTRRFAQKEAELRSIYAGLYQDETAYAYFCSMLADRLRNGPTGS